MSDDHSRRSFLGAFRASFLTGLVVVLPVGLTIYVVWGVIGWIDGWILPLIPAAYQPEAVMHRIFGEQANFPVRGVGVLVFLIVTAIIGWAARGLIGRTMMRQAESMVDRVPLVRSVYSGSPKPSLPRRKRALSAPVWWNSPAPEAGRWGWLPPPPRARLPKSCPIKSRWWRCLSG